MTPPDATIAAFAQSLKEKAKLPATIESYCRDARDFLHFIERHHLAATDVEPKTLVAFQDYLIAAEHDKANSVRRKVIGVRQFFRFLAENQTLRSTPFDDVPIPDRSEILPRESSLDMVEKILELVSRSSDSLKNSRDCAIVKLLSLEGLKANEIIELEWRDFYAGAELSTLTIRGPRARIITLEAATKSAILAYKSHFDAIAATRPQTDTIVRMFIAFQGRDDTTPIPRITRHGLKFLLYECGKDAGMSHCNTELLRHYAITYQLDSGRSPEAIMHHLGLRRLGLVAKHMNRNSQQEAGRDDLT